MTTSLAEFDRVAILGVGLIGGSIALAAKRWGASSTVIGYGRNLPRLELAQERGIIDEVATSPEQLKTADLIVVCTPVDRIATDVIQALTLTSGTGAIVTDAGSVKGSIQAEVNQHDFRERYVGAHPLAGSHESGFEYSTANMMLTKLCVVTPAEWPETSEAARRVCRFWEQIGMSVRVMSVEEHDNTLSYTSHLPHLAASALASVIDPVLLEFASSGYRDTTRIASGDAALWAAILQANSTEVIKGVDRLLAELQNYRNSLSSNDLTGLKQLLKNGCDNRRQYRHDLSVADSAEST